MASERVLLRAPDAKSSLDAVLKDENGCLPKITRLTKRQDFLALTKKGSKVFSASVVMQARQRQGELTGIRIGFTASRKVGNAVERNRAKRRMRAAAAEIFPARAQQGWDYVIIARSTVLTHDYKKLKKDLAYSLKQLRRIKNKDKV